MDIEVALREARELAAKLLDPEQIDCAEHAQELGMDLAEKFQAIDQWLSKDGFFPADWSSRNA